MSTTFWLEEPRTSHEQAARKLLVACQAISEVHGFNELDKYLAEETNEERPETHGHRPSYVRWLDKIDSDRHCFPNRNHVRSETYFVLKKEALDGICTKEPQVIGIVNIRLDVNRTIWMRGGHISFTIHPDHRDYTSTLMALLLALQIVKQRRSYYGNEPIEGVLIRCARNDELLKYAIHCLGGILLREFKLPAWDCLICQYVIDVKRSVAKNEQLFRSWLEYQPPLPGEPSVDELSAK